MTPHHHIAMSDHTPPSHQVNRPSSDLHTGVSRDLRSARSACPRGSGPQERQVHLPSRQRTCVMLATSRERQTCAVLTMSRGRRTFSRSSSFACLDDAGASSCAAC